MKEEALKLADELEALHQYVPSEAPATIRRLVARIEFSERFAFDMNIRAVRAEKAMQTKPLSDEEILNSWVEIYLPEECWITDEHLINFARAIEERHGIK